MKPRRRLFSTLLINIFVSALVTGTVIFFYDRVHRAECNASLPNVATTPADNVNVNVDISGVIGVGNLQDERMVIQNDGTEGIELTGWSLTDNKGLVYTFPQLILHPGAKVQVHSASGKDTPSDLYWGRSVPVWTSGELAALYDTQNIARAFYRVP
jgi:Lamin Tail Domain